MASIELRGVVRRYGPSRPALDEVDLTVSNGERLAVLGPSGSGKSTLLRLVAGLDRPTGGGVWFGGLPMDGVPPHRRDVAMVFQEPTLLPHLDVAGNMEFGLRARGVPRPERRRRVAEVSGLLRIDGLLARRPATLSGGEAQRAAIGRAIVRRPAVLLLDEPFSSLDLPLRSALRRDLVDLHDRFRPTLLHVTHDQGEALALGQRVAILDGGRVLQVGPPRQVYESPASPAVARFVGDPPMNLIPCELRPVEGACELEIGPRSLRLSPDSPNRPEIDRRSPILLGIRPEHLRIGREAPPGGSALAATIIRVEDRGDATIVQLDVSGLIVLARLPAEEAAEPGESVHLELDLDRASWFAR